MRLIGFESIVTLIFMLSSALGGKAAPPADDGGDAFPFTEALLCIHNGGDYYVNGPFHGQPNEGGAKYFPSFSHWTSTSANNLGAIYPWKIRGWGWSGMQVNSVNDIWVWQSCLQATRDNPWSTTMSWDYPVLYCTGTVPHSGTAMPIYGGNIPSCVPDVGGNQWIFPSSSGGWDAYLNIFASIAASWIIPSTTSFYAYDFSVTTNCGSAVTVPSSHSIWEVLWNSKGLTDQYLILSGDETDCLGGPGNKGRCYSLLMEFSGPYFWYWINGCSGIETEWAMCLQVCDAVTIPVNIPGSANPSNPFSPYGFDVGSTTLTPYASSNCAQLGFMTEDGAGLGGGRVILASLVYAPCIGPYGKNNFRIPHSFDMITSLILQTATLFMHIPAPGYPACMFGSTTGGHSAFIPFSAHPALLCMEVRYSSYAMVPGAPMSASYMVTLF